MINLGLNLLDLEVIVFNWNNKCELVTRQLRRQVLANLWGVEKGKLPNDIFSLIYFSYLIVEIKKFLCYGQRSCSFRGKNRLSNKEKSPQSRKWTFFSSTNNSVLLRILYALRRYRWTALLLLAPISVSIWYASGQVLASFRSTWNRFHNVRRNVIRRTNQTPLSVGKWWQYQLVLIWIQL